MIPKISVCIACHNQSHLLGEAVVSVLNQDYRNFEVIVLDDASTDNPKALGIFAFPEVKYFKSEEPSGAGGAFNKAMDKATGEYIVFLCADDIFTDKRVLSDIADIFNKQPRVSHVSRYYYQFIDGDRRPVRAWRCNDIIELANNPSGLAFRKSSLTARCRMTNKMFVEAPTMVYEIMLNPKNYSMIMPWDTVAIRIHQSTARSKDYYKKRWVSSPVEEWSKIGGSAIQQDFTSLIQIKNYFSTSAVIKECLNFLRLRPINILDIGFWFFAIVSIFTPRFILLRLPEIYRSTFGRWTTKEVKRP